MRFTTNSSDFNQKPWKSLLVFSIFWTFLIIVLIGFDCVYKYEASYEMVKVRSKDLYEKEMAYRLKEMSFEFDLLTSADTSYKFVDIHKVRPFLTGIYGHFIALETKLPDNIPDPWELKALQSFEHGGKEVSSIETINNQRFLRYIVPLTMDKKCLGCHGAQGLQPGDRWGGISFDIPWEPEIASFQARIIFDVFIFFGIWVFGLGGIYFSWRLLQKYIIAQKRVESDLKESEERYRLLFENQGEGVGLVDTAEYFVYANPAAERIFGVLPGGLAGRNLKNFLPPNQISQVFIETMKRSLAEASTYEHDIVTPDNQVRNLLVTATPQVNREGAITGALSVFRDITERKMVEAELEKFTKALQESNATKDKFFSIIAHDLKSPFNSILGLINMLIDEYQTFDEKEIEHTLNTIKKSSERAFELLNNLLIWANSQTGQIIFNPQEFNLTITIEESVALVEVQAARKKIRIVCGCTEDFIVSGDKQMIQTILRNLMSNAIKFTPQGGRIEVSVDKSENHYMISVKDTGLGIAEQDIPKLFKIESKYSTSGTSNEKGTGLGLILCKEFVEKHGGKIWVESEVGKGSTFYFTLNK